MESRLHYALLSTSTEKVMERNLPVDNLLRKNYTRFAGESLRTVLQILSI